MVQRGLANVDKARSKSRGTARMAVDRWNEMLMRSDIAAIRDTLLGDSDDAREMRNSAVFSGVIPEPRRMQIVRGVLNAA
ncbi:hypothetical protein [Microbacterium keratanolyticum]|uniref:hypothetical protein n=1 Tax=Microbacterium keratanolyticum TaxID=67574 RepID=UPI00195E1A08|nr:hypothetical protein [Microbacterium keratanolyticum]